ELALAAHGHRVLIELSPHDQRLAARGARVRIVLERLDLVEVALGDVADLLLAQVEHEPAVAVARVVGEAIDVGALDASAPRALGASAAALSPRALMPATVFIISSIAGTSLSAWIASVPSGFLVSAPCSSK